MRDSKPMLFRKYRIIGTIFSIIISIIMMPTVMASEKAGWAEIPANCGAARLLKHFFTDDGGEDDEVDGDGGDEDDEVNGDGGEDDIHLFK